jgi:hypothetical protein
MPRSGGRSSRSWGSRRNEIALSGSRRSAGVSPAFFFNPALHRSAEPQDHVFRQSGELSDSLSIRISDSLNKKRNIAMTLHREVAVLASIGLGAFIISALAQAAEHVITFYWRGVSWIDTLSVGLAPLGAAAVVIGLSAWVLVLVIMPNGCPRDRALLATQRYSTRRGTWPGCPGSRVRRGHLRTRVGCDQIFDAQLAHVGGGTANER